MTNNLRLTIKVAMVAVGLLAWSCHSAGHAQDTTKAKPEIIRVNERRTNLLLFNSGDEFMYRTVGRAQIAAWADPHTAVSTDEGRLVLHTGRLVVSSFDTPLTVGTRLGTVRIDSHVTAVIELRPGKPARICVASGPEKPCVRVRPPGRMSQNIWLEPGEELLISNAALEESDLNPSDGLKRHPLPLLKKIAGVEIRKQSLPAGTFARRELANLKSVMNLSGSKRAVLRKIEQRVPENSEAASLPFATAPGMPATKTPGAGSDPLHVMSSGGAELVQDSTTGAIKLRSGSILVHPSDQAAVKTPLAEVVVGSAALASVEVSEGGVRVNALTGPGDVSVLVGKHKVSLPPGQEALITSRSPQSHETNPPDGVGRRNVSTQEVNGDHFVTLADFSIVSMINSADHLRTVKRPSSTTERQLRQRLLKTAAAVQTLTQAKGPYSAQSKKPRLTPRPSGPAA